MSCLLSQSRLLINTFEELCSKAHDLEAKILRKKGKKDVGKWVLFASGFSFFQAEEASSTIHFIYWAILKNGNSFSLYKNLWVRPLTVHKHTSIIPERNSTISAYHFYASTFWNGGSGTPRLSFLSSLPLDSRPYEAKQKTRFPNSLGSNWSKPLALEPYHVRDKKDFFF